MAEATRKKEHALNQSERNVNKEVFSVYNLTRDDFQTDREYDDFLEEREEIIYDIVHNHDPENARSRMQSFKELHYAIIEKRAAQNIGARQNANQSITLPLLAQIKMRAKAMKADNSSFIRMHERYTNSGFLNEIKRRKEEWTERDDIEVDTAGGLPREMFFLKVNEEIAQTLFIERNIQTS